MGNVRNTVAYFKKESVVGTAVVPTSKTDGYCSIEKPDVSTGEKELLESDLLTGNIGVKKPQLGFESASASITTELRSHGDSSSPTEPDFGVLINAAIGDPETSTADAVESLPVPNATTFRIGTEGNIKKFDMMLIENATDGRVVRFCKSLSLYVETGANDKIDFNEGGGPLAATLDQGSYIHGSDDVAGSIGEEIKTKMEVVSGGTITVTGVENDDGSWDYTIANSLGVYSLLNNTGTNAATSFLVISLGFSGAADATASASYTSDSSVWGTLATCNQAMTSAPDAADVVHASVNYKPLNEGHPHFTAGFYQGNSAVDGYFEQVVAALVASMNVNIEVGAVAKMTFDVQGLKGARTATTAAPHVPEYEAVQGLVGFCVQTYIGNTLVDANTLDFTIADEISEKKSFKECSGKLGSIVRKRAITGTINPFADGSTQYYDALTALTDYEMSIVIGRQDSGGFIVGEVVGFYFPNIMLTAVKSSDIDDNMVEEISFSAHTGSDGSETDVIASFS